MTISYNWLSEYLPVKTDPERLSRILTSIGLEVEKMEAYESIKGGLKGLVIGEVLECSQHPNADKLKLTSVNIGEASPLKIVCGAPNVAVGQKVVVAPIGVTIYPLAGDSLTMKLAKIRGEESQGMICAEDEIGLGESHAGIIVLPSSIKVGTPASDHFKVFTDTVYEIGLTPNRMDAMSHLGTARDVCAYLTHHDKKDLKAKTPSSASFKTDNTSLPITVTIENTNACQRYAGVSISGVTIKESPEWLQNRLKSIGLRPINNIVDITNFILHESGQPLHAFDAAAIKGNKIIVKNLPEGTPFITLDGKSRKLNSADLMICNAEEGMCIGGVFGGLQSGVSAETKNIFLESAWFNPSDIRKTSLFHGLRTDAATRFEKGVDISNSVNVLKRAAAMIKELAGGEISSEIVDVYPQPKTKTQVAIKYHYLKKLSGKNYHPDAVKKILEALGFEIVKDGIDQLWVAVPYHKPDISLPADLVEEVLRIDGLDNIGIPATISITPSVEVNAFNERMKQKITNYLVGAGFREILTNSITNSAYFSEAVLEETVKMKNSLSAGLDVMKPSMLQTGLESIAYNLNRKNSNLSFFEFGKTYSTKATGKYNEAEHLCLYVTGNTAEENWKKKNNKTDFYYLKGIAANILALTGVTASNFAPLQNDSLEGLEANIKGEWLLSLASVKKPLQDRFDIRQPVLFADFNWALITSLGINEKISFRELPKQQPVYRDLALVVPKSLSYEVVEKTVKDIKLAKLQTINLFDVFESEKLGADKKSMAVSFTFLDEEKTLTDQEIDGMMKKIMNAFEKELQAEIRK
jgi:phenylalanyl-tRNA synthetase beta chain